MPVRWTLPEDPSAPGIARRRVGSELAEWPNVDDIQLVASELTTNAIQHGGPPIHLALDLIGARLRLAVTSTALVATPQVRTAGFDDESGRGLAIVNELSDQWGWEFEDARIRVWADFAAG